MRARSVIMAFVMASLLPLATGAETAGVAVESSATLKNNARLPSKAVDLRPAFEQWGLTSRQQGKRPTCSAFTVAGALEFAVAQRERHGERFSVEFLNWAANKACGDTKDGGFFSALWKGFTAYGICAETNMPYRATFDPIQAPDATALADAKTRLSLGLRFHWIKRWNVHTGLTDEHLARLRHTLDQGRPVCSGLRWPKQEQWVSGVLQMCPSNAVYDGHSVLLVGYCEDAAQPGGGVFIFRNTSRSGRDGFMPYAYAQAYINDAAWMDCAAQKKAPSSKRASSGR